MRRRKALSILQLCALSTIVNIFVCCSDSVKILNNPPENLKIEPEKCFVATGKKIDLFGYAEDADGDSLIFKWSATAGTIYQTSPGSSKASWTAPGSPGSVTITMSVTDEIETRKIDRKVEACELLPSQILNSRTIQSLGYAYITRADTPTRIAAPASVVIEPGVVIVLDGQLAAIECFGRIEAIGSSSQKIVFRSSACAGQSNPWQQISLVGSDAEGIFRHCSISQGREGISAEEGAKIDMRDCEVFDIAETALRIMGSSAGLIRDCKIWDNGTGIYIETSSAEIGHCSIRYNSQDGIIATSSLAKTQAAIDSCVVANNYRNGFVLEDKAAPAIHYCSIFANAEGGGDAYAIKLSANTSEDSIHAERNYWGLGNNSQEKIALIVYDANDNPSAILAYVSFVPWLEDAPVSMRNEEHRRKTVNEAWGK